MSKYTQSKYTQERGGQDRASDDKCPKCGAMYMADHGNGQLKYPVSPLLQVQCFMCDHTGPIKDWWDAFDKNQ